MSESRIIVGIDGSQAAENALLWAAAEAQRRGLGLVIAYAGDVELPAPPGEHEAARSGGSLLAAAERLLADAGCRCEVETVCRSQPAVAMLSQLGENAELLVVGAHGMARDHRHSLGSVAYGVAAHGLCPVAVIGSWTPGAAGAEDACRPVTVGVRANPVCAPTLEFAFAEAARRGAAVTAVHSWAEADRSEAAALAAVPRNRDALRAYHERRIAEILAPLREKYPQVTVEARISGDPVATSLAAASEGSSMLVLGCRRPGGPLGPTATRLLHVSRCPVVIVGNPCIPPGAATQSPRLAASTP